MNASPSTIESPATARGIAGVLRRARQGETLSEDDGAAFTGADSSVCREMCAAASEIRDLGKGRVVSFSPKVFIPLTRLCRDFCGYCTFRQDPESASSLYMTPEEVLAVVTAGEKLGCTEALFTLGERPEQRYPAAARWLQDRGYASTLDYLAPCLPAGLGADVADAPRQPRHHEPAGNGLAATL